MNPQEELEKLRTEARELRRRIGVVENAWSGQTKRAEKEKKRAEAAEQRAKALEERIRELGEKNKKLEAENETLKAKLAGITLYKDKLAGMLFKTTNAKKEAAARPVGGQIGHQGHGRKNPKRIDEEKTVYLSRCPKCESPVGRSHNSYERIVEEVVVPAITKITKYTIERQWCVSCHQEVHGNPANTLPGFRLGINALSLILFLKYRLRLSLELMAESLKVQYGLKITEGALVSILKKLSHKLTPAYQKIIEEMRDSPVKHADETSWRIEGRAGWCWAFLSPKAVAYTIEETRGKAVPDKILGTHPTGVLVRDDYGSYEHLPMEQQSCWSHLMRNSRDMLKQEMVSKGMKDLYAELASMYRVFSAVIARPFDETERMRNYALLEKQIKAIISRRYRHDDAKKIQTRIKNQGNKLITAILHNSVPATNNLAERMMRPVAVMRKISGGSRSHDGAKATAVNMSVVQTITLKKQSFFDRMITLLTPLNQKFSLEGSE